MQEVTLQQMLEAREMRVALQKSLLNTYKTPLICFTMNIAGPIKTSQLIERAFFEGIELLQSRLPKKSILHQEIDVSATGCQAMFCASMNAQKLKAICTDIEESCPLGRLFDMDVLDTDGTKLNRNNTRGCIVCGAPGRECAAGRIHTVPQLQSTTYKIITEHFFLKDCKRLSKLAIDSLLEEVYTTPKPGLVDRCNNGSHTDMDVNTFVKSAYSLKPYFCQCIALGHQTYDKPLADTFKELKKVGIAAENTMYQVTGGVNTHKGAIYSLGIICGVLGRLWKIDFPVPNIKEIFSLCAEMTQETVESDFQTIDNTTAGGRLYLEYGLKGIRGEVSAGFPSVATIGLPIYQKELDKGLSSNDAGAITLIYLISNVQDTNLHHRGGYEGALYAKNRAKLLLTHNTSPTKSQIKELDKDFIARNLSPGGCADLLAITYFTHKLNSQK